MFQLHEKCSLHLKHGVLSNFFSVQGMKKKDLSGRDEAKKLDEVTFHTVDVVKKNSPVWELAFTANWPLSVF